MLLGPRRRDASSGDSSLRAWGALWSRRDFPRLERDRDQSYDRRSPPACGRGVWRILLTRGPSGTFFLGTVEDRGWRGSPDPTAIVNLPITSQGPSPPWVRGAPAWPHPFARGWAINRPPEQPGQGPVASRRRDPRPPSYGLISVTS